MANPEHVALARAGASAIARWRETHYRIPNPKVHHYSLSYQLGDRSTSEDFEPEFIYGRSRLDLSGAFLSRARLAGVDLSFDDLNGTDLTACNLRQARLTGANLSMAHLSRANLTRATFAHASMAGCSMVRSDVSSSDLQMAQLKGANLSYSNMSYTNLEGADLSSSNLSFADLSWANLRQANLRGANLTVASLRMADLTGADLRGAYIYKANLDSAVLADTALGITRLINCDLSKAIGLETTRHTGPSTIGLDTFAKSGGMLPNVFLENAGVAAPLIASQAALRELNQHYPTVLIIGCQEDRALAEFIKSQLSAARLPTWNIGADDEDSLRSGDTILGHSSYYDQLVLLCTSQSLESPQTSQYFAELTERRGSGFNPSLIVVAADNNIYDREDQLCSGLKEELVLDFRGWENSEVFRKALTSLVQTLTRKTP